MCSSMFKLAFWVFVLFLSFSFFGISVEAIVSSPAGQENFGYLAYLLVTGWQWLVGYVQNLIGQLATAVEQ